LTQFARRNAERLQSVTEPVPSDGQPRLSIVVPVRNEQGNIAPLIRDIESACAGIGAFELIYVDDGSSDGTAADWPQDWAWRTTRSQGRVTARSASAAAVRSGVRAAKASIVATLDGDGQNDPSFIPGMLAQLEAAGASAGMVQGQRVGRKDTGFKRMQSRIANKVRGAILKDGTRDTGCGLKCFRRDAYLALPYFDALHRFMPALVVREGLAVLHHDVRDRQRLTGVSNYGFFDRLWVGILDLAGVWWLIRRRKHVPQIATEAR
jgi:dolichol-phosphate mannosyltransferase